jgi:hypothetical protein
MFLKLWQGQHSLLKTYWFFGVLGNIFLGIPISIYLALSSELQQSYLYIYVGYFFAYLVYNFVVAVGLWRSATNYDKSKVWKYLAKAVSVISLGFLFVAIFMQVKLFTTGFSLSEQHVYDRYECTKKATKPDEDCGLVFFGTIKYTVDKTNNQILALRTDASGFQSISKLSNCLIIDDSNWSCIPSIQTENINNNVQVFNQLPGVQTIKGVTSTTNGYLKSFRNGDLVSTFVIHADVLKKKN